LFFVLSKILHFLTAPIVWVLFLLLLAVLVKNSKKIKRRLFVALTVLLVFSNTALFRSIRQAYEIPPAEWHTGSDYSAGIVLGGMASYNHRTGQPVFNEAGDRLMQTLHLYHTGVIDKIIISGGSGYLFRDEIKEAPLIKQFLINNRIPESDILLESQSRNTYENARFTADLIKQKEIDGPFLLITSSLHLPRALKCFEKQGINPDVYPAESRLGAPLTPSDFIVPDAATLNDWKLLFHEIIGLFAYRLAGYI